jgi:hypothetical protein
LTNSTTTTIATLSGSTQVYCWFIISLCCSHMSLK